MRLGDLVSAMVFAKATICLVNGCMAAWAGLFGLAYVRATQIPDYMYVEDTNRSFRSYLGNFLFNWPVHWLNGWHGVGNPMCGELNIWSGLFGGLCLGMD